MIFREMCIFPENLATFEQKKLMLKNVEEIFVNWIQTLTSEAKVFNQKVCGIQGRRPGGV